MWSKEFWQDTAERVLSTAVVAFGAAFTGTAAMSELDWKVVGVTTAMAALGTLVKCVMASGKSDTVSPASLVK